MGIIRELFSGDAATKAATGIYRGLDAIAFTDEEKSRFFERLLTAYEPFKKAQRLLALTVVATFVGLHVVAATAGFIVAPGLESVVMQTSARELITLNNDTLGTPSAIILGFYFGGGMLEGAIRARK